MGFYQEQIVEYHARCDNPNCKEKFDITLTAHGSYKDDRRKWKQLANALRRAGWKIKRLRSLGRDHGGREHYAHRIMCPSCVDHIDKDEMVVPINALRKGQAFKHIGEVIWWVIEKVATGADQVVLSRRLDGDETGRSHPETKVVVELKGS